MEPTKEVGSGEKQPLGPVVQIDEGRIQAHLDGVVRSTVEVKERVNQDYQKAQFFWGK
jgi:hypothetical protein